MDKQLGLGIVEYHYELVFNFLFLGYLTSSPRKRGLTTPFGCNISKSDVL